MAVILETSVGDLTIDLHVDECPRACKNFLKLCKTKYYNNVLFHNVQKNFMVSTGDPTGTGEGGESIYHRMYGEQAKYFDDEIHNKLRHRPGTVSMVNKGAPNTNASQFFFATGKELDYLDGKHTLFGEIAEEESMETLMKINEAFVDEKGRPLQNIRIKHTIVLDDPFPDPGPLLEMIPDASPEPVRTHTDRLEAGEEVEDEFQGLTQAEIDEKMRKQEAHSAATVLEMIGDLPDADIAPPDNVLFVCKLNPVTRDEDLELIFSRFGGIIECEIVKDWKTGDSLQYAFIEFETAEQCEQAYYKMDNCLIDDRRIKVDFSQSVSKMWNSWRRGDRDMGSKSGSDGKATQGGRSVSKNLELKSKYDGGSLRARERAKGGGPIMLGGAKRKSEQSSDTRGHGSSSSSSSSSSRRRSRSRSPKRHRERQRDRNRSNSSSSSSSSSSKRSREGGRDRRDRSRSRGRGRRRSRSRDRSRRHR